MQTSIETRTADLTPALLVLPLALLMRGLPRPPASSRAGAPSASAPPEPRHRALGEPSSNTVAAGTARSYGTRTPAAAPDAIAHAARSRLAAATSSAVAAVLIAAALHAVLALPGIPYNVRELFRGDGHSAALLMFALGVLWIGAGAVWLARRLEHARQPGLVLLPAAWAVSLVSLALVWSGVTTESIEDIAGSNNVFWFVTNRDLWGESARKLFLWLDAPGPISFIERCVRYPALYAPVPIVLGGLIAVYSKARGSDTPWRWWLSLALGTAATIWLCKSIAFTWSSTDNLNELLARRGEWGVGGGPWLYALVALMSLGALSLVWAARRGPLQWLLALLGNAAAVPLGWWLLNHGLEARVEKYSLVFSGAQFLLGPDRSHLMSESELMARWIALQLAAVTVMALGVGFALWWAGSRLAAPRRRD